MFVCKVEKWPDGDETAAVVYGTIVINAIGEGPSVVESVKRRLAATEREADGRPCAKSEVLRCRGPRREVCSREEWLRQLVRMERNADGVQLVHMRRRTGFSYDPGIGSGALDAFIEADAGNGRWCDPRSSWRHETSRDVALFAVAYGLVETDLIPCKLRLELPNVRCSKEEWSRLLCWARSDPWRFFLFDRSLDIVLVDEAIEGGAIDELDERVDAENVE
jgi:hypothetical protein